MWTMNNTGLTFDGRISRIYENRNGNMNET